MVDFKKIEEKWQKKWEESRAFEVDENKKPKFYVLEMFPYPSASGLHMGHALNYSIGDIFARFKRMQGFNILHPMGFDSFGLPAENAAIKANSHPKIFTEKAIKNYIKQMKSLGISYSWDRKVETHKPDYFKWDQWIFLKMFEKDLAYKKDAIVNWCPKCKTVLANEQVHDGKCWRHTDTEVEVINLKQWFFKITEYAEELYDDIDLKLQGWPERVKIMQKNWIGKSYGTLLKFDVVDEEGNKIDEIETFTTRPDTAFGITYLVLAVEHPKIKEWVKGTEYEKKVEEFAKDVMKMSKIERTAEGKEKKGMFIGKYFINPFTKEKLPLWIADYALYDYGTGAVMAVPAHDQRDFDFAKKYNLPIKEVIIEKHGNEKELKEAYTEKGILINSGNFNGLDNETAKKKMTEYAEKNNFGKKTINYKLKDWLVSRQRFWGTPIPIIHCDVCGEVPVPEKDLPVELPEKITFGKGNPLETNEEWIKTRCPKCGKEARRETDTMDTFVNSSWYFLRYTDPKNEKEIFDKKKAKYWMPVDQYIGGAEHACMHLIYFRFYTKFLRDLGLLDFDEPAIKLFNQGMLHGPDGEKMSKSKGNVVLPETVSEKYGIDTARFFLTSAASPDKDVDWSESGIEGSSRFIKKVFDYFSSVEIGKSSPKVESKLHKAIKGVTEDIENFRYNLATIKIRSLFDSFEEETSKDTLEGFVKLLHPFCPHITEELWEKLGNKDLISLSSWPKYDESKIDEEAEIIEETIVNIKKDIQRVMELAKIEKPKKIKIIVSPKWKFEFYKIMKEEMEKTRDVKTLIGKIMGTDLKRYGNDIIKIIPSVVKDPSKMPLMILTQKKELSAYEKAKDFFEGEFDCLVEIELAEKSSEKKANVAMPLKPAIVLE